MTRSEVEQYIGKTVRVKYINKVGMINDQVMILETTSFKKAHFLLYDAEEDIAPSIPLDNIIKIRKVKEDGINY